MMYKKNLLIALGAFLFSSAVSASDDITRGEMIGVTCAGCHGTDGVGGTAIPPLKGRDLSYMEEALIAYRNDKRPGSIMPRIAKGYTEEELKAVAAYFASMKKD